MSGMHLGKLLMFTSIGSTAVAEFFMGGKGHIKRIIDREPIVAFSVVLGTIGFSAPLVIPEIRRSMGYDTSQYHGRPGAAPVSIKEVSLSKKPRGIYFWITIDTEIMGLFNFVFEHC